MVNVYLSAMNRQLGLWGYKGQEKLYQAKVAVAGIGGIGAISALMLVKAGIGQLTICDRDTYGRENIVEQIFATYDAIDVEKVLAAQNEMKRHTKFTEIDGFTGDLSDEATAMRLVEKADILISGVDNPDARIVLGKVCAKQNIPMVVSANIGWSVLHTVYFPGKYGYNSVWQDVKGLTLKDGFPDMDEPATNAAVKREWNIWVVALSNYEPDAIRQFIKTKDQTFYWYAAPPAYFASSIGILDTLKILIGLGQVYTFPNIFFFDMKRGKILTWDELCKRRNSLQEVWEQGEEEILRIIQAWS